MARARRAFGRGSDPEEPATPRFRSFARRAAACACVRVARRRSFAGRAHAGPILRIALIARSPPPARPFAPLLPLERPPALSFVDARRAECRRAAAAGGSNAKAPKESRPVRGQRRVCVRDGLFFAGMPRDRRGWEKVGRCEIDFREIDESSGRDDLWPGRSLNCSHCFDLDFSARLF